VSNDANSSVLSLSVTPLKAIDNICPAAAAAAALDDSGRGASVDQLVFARPRQTSTPAAARISPRKVVPLMDLELDPLKRPMFCSRFDDAAAGAGSFSQDGGFLMESQSVGLTPVMPLWKSIKPGVVDLTIDDVTETQFRPVIASTQRSVEPITHGNASCRLSKPYPRISEFFENSFADGALDAVAENKFKPIAVSTQISPKALTTCSVGPRNANLENSFAVETSKDRVLESGGGENPVETGLGQEHVSESCQVAREKDGDVLKSCNTSAHEPSQQLASRSPSPELFDCDDAPAENVKVLELLRRPCSNSSSTTQSKSDACHKAVTSASSCIHQASIPCTTTVISASSSIHQASVPCTTIAQKLANKKLRVEDGVNSSSMADDLRTCNQRPPSESEKVPHGSNGSSVKELEMSGTQTRRSARLSTRSTWRTLHSSRLRSRGVDFLDEIDEVCCTVFCVLLH